MRALWVPLRTQSASRATHSYPLSTLHELLHGLWPLYSIQLPPTLPCSLASSSGLPFTGPLGPNSNRNLLACPFLCPSAMNSPGLCFQCALSCSLKTGQKSTSRLHKAIPFFLTTHSSNIKAPQVACKAGGHPIPTHPISLAQAPHLLTAHHAVLGGSIFQ